MAATSVPTEAVAVALVPAEDLATATEVSKALHMAVVAAKSTSTMAAARDKAAPATFLAKKTQEETNEASCRHFFSPFLLVLVSSGEFAGVGIAQM
jgi:hypothetical protein